MIKIRIENQGDLVHDVRVGKIRFDIPQGAGPKSTFVDLPDSELTWKSISKLIERHKALSFEVIEQEGDGEAEQDTEQPDVSQSQEPIFVEKEKPSVQPAAVDPFEAFKDLVTGVEKGSAGWWTVNLRGRDPMKVRSATDEESAMRLAYETILEDRE